MSGPLTGLRVIELPSIGPAPFATMLLADLGADVVRIDRPDAGPLQVVPPEQDLLGRGKRSVVLDLKAAADVDRLLALVVTADILVEGFRPGVAERLGIGPDDCRSGNPRLIYGRMTGWGQDGPYAGMAGHDITYIATAGALHAIGPADGQPQVPLNLIGDFAGALYLVAGLLAAVHEREHSGEGQVVDAAMVDSTAHLLTAFHGLLAAGSWQDERGSNLLDGSAPFYGVYETADGGHLAVGALEPQFYDELLRLLGIPTEQASRDDPTTWPELRDRVAAAVATRTRAEWAEILAGSDACASPVLSLLESRDDPHLRARTTFVDVDGVTQPAPAPRFSRTPGSIERPPPRAGAHTDEVSGDWLGLKPGSRANERGN